MKPSQTGVVYSTEFGLTGDLYLPKTHPAAIVVFAHGGGFLKGSRTDEPVEEYARFLCAAGFAMFSIDYRISTPLAEFPRPMRRLVRQNVARSIAAGLTMRKRLFGPAMQAAVQDLSQAIGFSRTMLGTPLPVGVLGLSAGGIAACALSFPTPENAQLIRPDGVVGISAAVPHPWAIDASGVPTLLIHGTADKIIGPENPDIAAKIANECKAPLTLVTTGEPGHGHQVNLVLGSDTSWTQMITQHFDVLQSGQSLRM